MAAVSGGRGGRGGRGRKKGGKKGMRDTQAIWVGQGKNTRSDVHVHVCTTTLSAMVCEQHKSLLWAVSH